MPRVFLGNPDQKWDEKGIKAKQKIGTKIDESTKNEFNFFLSKANLIFFFCFISLFFLFSVFFFVWLHCFSLSVSIRSHSSEMFSIRMNWIKVRAGANVKWINQSINHFLIFFFVFYEQIFSYEIVFILIITKGKKIRSEN